MINQVKRPCTVVLDTMNYWIENKFDALMEAIGKVEMLVIDEVS